MINKRMVLGLVGELDFTEILIHLPDEFYKLTEHDQDYMWSAVLSQINDGIREIPDLITFSYFWVETFLQIQDIPAGQATGAITY